MPPCRQLIVWDPDSQLILGGYRFITGSDIRFDDSGRPRIATSHMFNFSNEFIKNYLPATIELGRSFVRLEYQSSRAGAKALYVLDNLWDGLGALTVVHPEIKHLLAHDIFRHSSQSTHKQAYTPIASQFQVKMSCIACLYQLSIKHKDIGKARTSFVNRVNKNPENRTPYGYSINNSETDLSERNEPFSKNVSYRFFRP